MGNLKAIKANNKAVYQVIDKQVGKTDVGGDIQDATHNSGPTCGDSCGQVTNDPTQFVISVIFQFRLLGRILL